MIRISSTSNGREYSAFSEEQVQRRELLVSKRAWFAFQKSWSKEDKNYPAQIEIGCQYNALVGNESLTDGSIHIREGKFSMPFHELLDVCLQVLEEDDVTLHHPQFNRMLLILADQHKSRKKFRK